MVTSTETILSSLVRISELRTSLCEEGVGRVLAVLGRHSAVSVEPGQGEHQLRNSQVCRQTLSMLRSISQGQW